MNALQNKWNFLLSFLKKNCDIEMSREYSSGSKPINARPITCLILNDFFEIFRANFFFYFKLLFPKIKIFLEPA